jgi:hypothetical protein
MRIRAMKMKRTLGASGCTAAGAAHSTFPPARASRGEAKAAHAAARRLRA